MSRLRSIDEILGGTDVRQHSLLQLVRRLERELLQHSSTMGDLFNSVGCGIDPSKEVLRFSGHASLAFPPQEVLEAAFDPERPGAREAERLPINVTVSSLGLFGPDGVLPLYYTALIRERTLRGDFTLRDFLDLINHRYVSFYYRAWAIHHPEVIFERERCTSTRLDPLSLYLQALCGDAPPAPGFGCSATELPLQYASLFAQGPRSASALQGLLLDYFEPILAEALPARGSVRDLTSDIPVPTRYRRLIEIEQLLPQYLPLSATEQTLLGEHNQTLGESLVLGDVVCVENAKFRIRIGPLSYAQYKEFLPPSEKARGLAFCKLVRLTRSFVGPEFDFDIELRLQHEEFHGFELGDSSLGGAWLGISTYLINQPPDEVAEAVRDEQPHTSFTEAEPSQTSSAKADQPPKTVPQRSIYPSSLVENWFLD